MHHTCTLQYGACMVHVWCISKIWGLSRVFLYGANRLLCDNYRHTHSHLDNYMMMHCYYGKNRH